MACFGARGRLTKRWVTAVLQTGAAIKIRSLLLLCLGVLWPAGMSGQALAVTLVDSASAAPLRGALLALVDAQGRAVVEVLTSENGFGNLTAPAGTYRL